MTAWNGFLLLCWVWAAVTVWYVALVVSEVVVYRRRAGKTAAAEDDPSCDWYGLHAEHGPAISWATDALYYWHGLRIPSDPDLIRTMAPEDVLREPNTEVRRAMIEIIGWPAFIAAAKLKQVGESVADPGNPGQSLALYDVPERIYSADVRVLVCVNATIERDGTRHTFGLTVPAEVNDPIAAAAWSFGVTPDQYRLLEAAC